MSGSRLSWCSLAILAMMLPYAAPAATCHPADGNCIQQFSTSRVMNSGTRGNNPLSLATRPDATSNLTRRTATKKCRRKKKVNGSNTQLNAKLNSTASSESNNSTSGSQGSSFGDTQSSGANSTSSATESANGTQHSVISGSDAKSRSRSSYSDGMASNASGESGDSQSGSNTGGSSAGSTGGYSAGSTGGYRTGSTGGYSAGSTVGYSAGSTGGYSAGSAGGYSAGSTSGYSVGSTGGYSSSSSSSFAESSSSGSEKDEYLRMHNEFRRAHGADALEWDEELAGKAKQWASRCVFQHSQGQLGSYGENLAMGGGLSPAQVVKMWTSEESAYSDANPSFSMSTGHFTQVVWKSTKKLGCAAVDCNGSKLAVCEYSPPGNMMGQFTENVQRS